MKFLLVASFPNSIVSFRGAMIRSIQALGHEVHALSPSPPENSDSLRVLEQFGCIIHSFDLDRKGMSVLSDLRSLLRIVFLLCTIKPDILFSYTIKLSCLYRVNLNGLPGAFNLSSDNRLGYAFQNEN